MYKWTVQSINNNNITAEDWNVKYFDNFFITVQRKVLAVIFWINSAINF